MTFRPRSPAMPRRGRGGRWSVPPTDVWPNGRSGVPDGVPAIVISPEGSDQTRCNIVAEVFVRANVGVALSGLAQHLEKRRTPAQQEAANARSKQIAGENRTALSARIADYEKHLDDTPVHPARIAKELAEALKTRAEQGRLSLENVALFDEALTSSRPFLDYVEHLGLHRLFYLRHARADAGSPWGVAGVSGRAAGATGHLVAGRRRRRFQRGGVHSVGQGEPTGQASADRQRRLRAGQCQFCTGRAAAW